jgi:CHASE2 domain-containing sensor protein
LVTKPTSEEWLAIARGLLSAITVASFVLICQLGGWLKPLQFVLEDLRFSASPRAASDSLVIVQIDPASISYVGRWPWPRGVHAQVIDKLIALRAKDIAIDIDFSSPSTPSEDTKLAEALRRAGGNVILPAFKQATFASNGMNSTVA